MSNSEATVICILGMHRSGTSLVSRTLNLLGVHLGSSQSISSKGVDNPKGYWEHHPIQLLNDEILARLQGTWDRPPAFPPDWQHDAGLEELRERARGLVREEFASQPLWGWKDPRTCLTLPFWQALVGGLRYVICVRNPSAVVASLCRRNAMTVDSAERLWLTYVQSALAHTTGQARMFVAYENLISDYRPELARLAAFIGHPARAADPDVCGEVEHFLEAELCHHRMSLEELAGDSSISFPTKAVYVAIQGIMSGHTLAQVSGGDDRQRSLHTALDLLAGHALAAAEYRPPAEMEALSRENGRLAASAAAAAAQRDGLAAERDGLTAERDGLTVERDGLALERDGLAVERDGLAAERDGLAAEREGLAVEVEKLAEDAAVLTAKLDDTARRHAQALRLADSLRSEAHVLAHDRDARARESDAAQQALDEIHASVAWRLVVASRRVAAALLPPGSRRRSLVDSVLHAIGRRLPHVRRVSSTR